MFGRLEFWGVFFTLLALSQMAAELYLTSFGAPGITHPWSHNLATVAYDVRHFPTLLLFFLLPLVVMALLPAWTVLTLTHGPVTARRASGRFLGLTVVAAAILVFAAWPASDLRREGFQRAAQRMAPLVGAIRRFDAERGRPPRDLTELAPRYLASVSQYGVRGCRSLQYSIAPADADWRWQLWLECPNGMMTLDRFVFRSSGEYPASASVERVGEWAYFWD